MSRKRHKPYDQMDAAELAAATREYDEEFGADRHARPLTARQRALHLRAAKRGPGRPRIGKGAAKLYISMERGLLKRADAFARKVGISRSELIARGVLAILGSTA